MRGEYRPARGLGQAGLGASLVAAGQIMLQHPVSMMQRTTPGTCTSERRAASIAVLLGYGQPFTGRGLAHFSARFGLKDVPVLFRPETNSPIFAAYAATIGTVPVNGYRYRKAHEAGQQDGYGFGAG